MTFFATMTYDLDPETPPESRKLLRAELVGRRWQDRYDGRLTPSSTVWIKRSAGPGETTDHLFRKCGEELTDAVAAVARSGRQIALKRAWIHVSGAGTFGPLVEDRQPHTRGPSGKPSPKT